MSLETLNNYIYFYGNCYNFLIYLFMNLSVCVNSFYLIFFSHFLDLQHLQILSHLFYSKSKTKTYMFLKYLSKILNHKKCLFDTQTIPLFNSDFDPKIKIDLSNYFFVFWYHLFLNLEQLLKKQKDNISLTITIIFKNFNAARYIFQNRFLF